MHLYNQQITSHSNCIGTRNTLMMLNLTNVVFGKIHMSNFLKNLNHLKHISMTEMSFENTTGIFVGLDGILGMTFTNCTMRTIYPYTFARVFNIKTLNLRGTNIHNIKDYSFCDLFNLSLLNLEANHIKQITRHTFQCLHKVNTLILSHNPITAIEHQLAAVTVHTSYHALCCYFTSKERRCYYQSKLYIRTKVKTLCKEILDGSMYCKVTMLVLAIMTLTLNSAVIVSRMRHGDQQKKTNAYIIVVAIGDIFIGIHWLSILAGDWYYANNYVKLTGILRTGSFCRYSGILPVIHIILPQTMQGLLSMKQMINVKYSMKNNYIMKNQRTIEKMAHILLVLLMFIIIIVYELSTGFTNPMCFILFEVASLTQIASIMILIYPFFVFTLRLTMHLKIIDFVNITGRVRSKVQRQHANKRIFQKVAQLLMVNIIVCLNMTCLLIYRYTISYKHNHQMTVIITTLCLSVQDLLDFDKTWNLDM